jgi:hypothetical protein
MIKIKAGSARNSPAIAKLPNAEVDYFKLKLIVHVLIRGSLVIKLSNETLFRRGFLVQMNRS